MTPVESYFLTKSFSASVSKPSPSTEYRKKEDEETFKYIATVAGNYFEGCVFEELSLLASGQRSNMTGAAAAAKRDFQNKKLFGFARTPSINGSGSGVALYLGQQVDVLRKNIEESAKITAAGIDKKIRETTKKNYTVSQKGGGSALGDLIVNIMNNELKDKTIVFELKYQITEGSGVRWFEMTEPGDLFNGAFISYLSQTTSKEKFWNYKKPQQGFTYDMRMAAMLGFLSSKSGGESAIFQYLLQKGDALKSEQFDKKEIVYARTTSETQVAMVLDLTTISKLETTIDKTAKEKQASLVFLNRQQEEIASFGMSEFKHDSKTPGPSGSSFEFNLYLAQKLFY